MTRHGAIAAHADHLLDIDPLDALGLQLGQFALQHRQRLRIRMADHHRRTLFVRQADRGLQLRVDRRFGALVIEKYIPRNTGQIDLLRLLRGDGLRAGAAVDEELVAALQLAHQPRHRHAVAPSCGCPCGY